MKRVNVAVTLLAVATTILFGVYYKQVYRTRDLTPPEITADEVLIHSNIHYTKEDLSRGITAIDAVDGDVTDSLMVESIVWVEDKTFNVTYAACDHSNNVGKYTRQVELSDYVAPRFVVKDALQFPLYTENSEILEYINAEDCIDGDITGSIKLDEITEDRKVDGIYDITFTAMNSLKHTVKLSVSAEFYTDSYDRRVNYPNIILSDYVVYVDRNSEFKPKSYLDHLEIGNDYYTFSSASGSKQIGVPLANSAKTKNQYGQLIAGTIHLSAIRMSTDLDLSVPGTYTVTFSCVTEDNTFGSTQMTVIVI